MVDLDGRGGLPVVTRASRDSFWPNSGTGISAKLCSGACCRSKELQNLPRPFFLRQRPSGYTDIEGEVWEIKEPTCLE